MANSLRMDGDRTARALARIEAASARIEAAAAQRPTPGPAQIAPANAPANAPDGELQDRYDRLHKEASTALDEIDALIGTLER